MKTLSALEPARRRRGNGLNNIDGCVYLGARGALVVTLHPETLDRVTPAWGHDVYCLVPLDHPRSAEKAFDHQGNVLWISSRPPSEIPGIYIEDFQGAWADGSTAYVRLGSQVTRHELDPWTYERGLLRTLAELVAREWSNQTDSSEFIYDWDPLERGAGVGPSTPRAA